MQQWQPADQPLDVSEPPTLIRSLLLEVIQQLPLRRLWVAHGSALPRAGATITGSPRIILGLDGMNNMDIPVGGQLKKVTLKPGEAVWIPATSHNQPHHDSTRTFLTLDFKANFIRYYLRRYHTLTRVVHAGHHRQRPLPEALRHILTASEVLSVEQTAHETLSGLVECAVREAFRELCIERPRRARSRSNYEVAQAYIDEHLAEPIARDEVASYLGLHPNHLSRLFREVSGETFNQYLTRARMQRAAQLLRSYNLEVGNVAARCGYRQVSYFCNVFRRYYGVSPSGYRHSLHRSD